MPPAMLKGRFAQSPIARQMPNGLNGPFTPWAYIFAPLRYAAWQMLPKGGRIKPMANARDTRMVMIVDSEPAQQRFLSALVSRGGWRSVVAGDTDTALAKLGTQEIGRAQVCTPDTNAHLV